MNSLELLPVIEDIVKMLQFPDKLALCQAFPSLHYLCPQFESKISTRTTLRKNSFIKTLLDCELLQDAREVWVMIKSDDENEALVSVKRNLIPGVSYDWFPVKQYCGYYFVSGGVASSGDRLTVSSWESTKCSQIKDAEVIVVFGKPIQAETNVNQLYILPSSVKRNREEVHWQLAAN